MNAKTLSALGISALLAACAPTTSAFGPNARHIEERRPSGPRFVETGACTWRGSAYRCPEGAPVTIQLRRGEDGDAAMWRTCPAGFVVQRTDEVPVGSTSVSSTYKSGGVLDPVGPLVGRKTNTYTETAVVTERRITFSCRQKPLREETEVVCSSSDVRSCVRRPTADSR